MYHLLHLLILSNLPRRVWDGGLRHDEHAGLDLKDVAVPQLAFLRVQRLVQSRRDHVLDADDARVALGAVVEDALAHLVVEVAAVMVGLDETAWIGCVGMVGIEMGTYIAERSKFLHNTVSYLENRLSTFPCGGSIPTCVAAAPVRRVWFFAERGSPAVWSFRDTEAMFGRFAD